MSISIVIGGDFCPINRIEKRLIKGENIFSDEIQSRIDKSDFFIANLECPISEKTSGFRKIGPKFHSSPRIINGLKNLGFSTLGLANNHFLDQGVVGAQNTIENLHKAEIDSFGFRKGKESFQHKTAKKNGACVSFFAYSNNEESVDNNSLISSLPINHQQIYYDLKEAEEIDSFKVVLLHSGYFNYPLPSPKMQELAHWIIDLGADLICFQHSHTVGAMEAYKGGTIVYGMGSLAFDKFKTTSFWNRGLILNLKITTKNKVSDFEIIETNQFDGNEEIVKIDKSYTRAEAIQMWAPKIENKEYLYKQWERYCNTKRTAYLIGLSSLPYNKIVIRIFEKLKLVKLLNRRQKQGILKNYFSNEEHLEIINTLLYKI